MSASKSRKTVTVLERLAAERLAATRGRPPKRALSFGGSYVTISRIWSDGDRVEVQLPMQLQTEAMPDDPSMQAILYGPLVS